MAAESVTEHSQPRFLSEQEGGRARPVSRFESAGSIAPNRGRVGGHDHFPAGRPLVVGRRSQSAPKAWRVRKMTTNLEFRNADGFSKGPVGFRRERPDEMKALQRPGSSGWTWRPSRLSAINPSVKASSSGPSTRKVPCCHTGRTRLAERIERAMITRWRKGAPPPWRRSHRRCGSARVPPLRPAGLRPALAVEGTPRRPD